MSKLVSAFPYFSILQLSEFVQVESLGRQTARQGFRMMLSMEHESDLRTIIVRAQLSPLSGDTLGYHDDVGPCMAETWYVGRQEGINAVQGWK